MRRDRLGDAADPHLRLAARLATARHRDRQPAVGNRQRHRQRQRSLTLMALEDRLLDRAAIAAKRMHAAVHHHLGRVNFAIAAHLGIGFLPCGIARVGERVFPAEVIPVIDRQADRNQRRIERKLTHQLVGRRAG